MTAPNAHTKGHDRMVEDRTPAPGPGNDQYPDDGERTVASQYQLFEYQRDVFERSVLFLETLRRRANNMLEHERAGMPPLLDFNYENLLDARRFERPVNYALLRITEIEGACWDDCVDPGKPPVIIVDPRAGHGPGIGGFKRDSEVGMALRQGHPVYFVVFFPEPAPAQTLADVLHALRRFVDAVRELHPGKPPVLYGNCQAGWAVTLLSADCEGLVGPAVLNGSPLSYWAGEPGVNPMRVSGGLLGGAWLAHLISDLGDGRFDGAWLVQNFENLKPERAVWQKYAELFTNIDDERERFLEFERWWNGFYFLGREEILAIVENLFIGNQLEQGLFRICDGCFADLRRVRNPLVIFASHGDNITPPHQALGWIQAVYKDTDDLKRAGQRIVYLINPHVGHLGIFVSAGVARLEHRAILENLDEISKLPPGLYEMKIETSADPLWRSNEDPQVRFEERQVEDLKVDVPAQAFDRVRRLSDQNEAAYGNLASPVVQAWATPWTAELLKWFHPMRVSRHIFSEAFNPLMCGVATMAGQIERRRCRLDPNHPLLEHERAFIKKTTWTLEELRKTRDAACEQVFSILFDAPWSPFATAFPAGSWSLPNDRVNNSSTAIAMHKMRDKE